MIWLSKKKLLSQVRDLKIMFVEIAFPIIILVSFFGFSKIQFVRTPANMTLDIFQYPEQPLIYNANFRPFGSQTERLAPLDFVQGSVACP